MRGPGTFVAFITCSALLSALPLGDGGTGHAAAVDDDIAGSVARIDRLTRAMWQEAGITPAPRTDDYGYIRRVTLDLAGRVPTTGEVEAFAADRSPDKRRALVDRLLASDDYVRRWTDVYLDLMLGRELRFRPQVGAPARDYFTEAFATNRPMDRIATELIASGGALDENGAVSYVVAHRLRGGSVESIAGKTARTFLGVQIQCAQCHDHPYEERYRREEFARFAAYFGGTGARRVDDPLLGPTLEIFDRPMLPYSPPSRMIDRRAARNPYILEPRFFGRDTPAAPGETRRQVLARTVVASPLFARVTVNRTWRHMFGRAIVTPWDDLGSAEDEHPPLLVALADDFAAHGFDHRRLLRVIALSAAYQRASTDTADAEAAERVFARAQVRPLGATQLFTAGLVATGVEGALRGMKRWRIERRIEQALREYLFTFADDETADADSFTGSVPQALLLRNGALTNQGTRAAPGTVLGRILQSKTDRSRKIEMLYLAAYARPPSAAERARIDAYIEAGAGSRRTERAAYEDVFHALLTSTEFTTNH